MKEKLKTYYHKLNRTNILFLFMGILVGLLFYFKTEDTYEENLFATLAANVQSTTPDADSTHLFLNSLRLVHDLLRPRQALFSELNGFKAGVWQPVTVDLMTGQGSCGSFSLTFVRLCKALGFETRVGQMKVDDLYGGHIIAEVKINNKWIVADPLYNLVFSDETGGMASFNEIHDNWDYYRQQVPDDYDLAYRYDDIRYTNWDKIPFVSAGLKKTLDWTLGVEKADSLSLRLLLINKNQFFFYITLLLFVGVLLYLSLPLLKGTKKAVAVNSQGSKTGTVTVINPKVKKTI